LRSTSPLAVVEDQAVAEPESPGLAGALGLWDVTAITAGTILGSAIFVAAAFVPREVPQPTLALLLWVAGGVIAIAGALSYAELGTMFPEAGGQYHYLKQAFGPLWGFLFGWTSLLAIQSGPVAYLGVAFGDYLGAFVPFFSSKHAIASISVGTWTWEPNTAQLAGVLAIAVLSAVNYFGTKQGARVQGSLTAIKLLSVVSLIFFGLTAPANVSVEWAAPLPSGNLLAAMGLAVVAVLGNFDGWLPMGAGAVPGGHDRTGPKYSSRAAGPVAPRRRHGGARCPNLSMAPACEMMSTRAAPRPAVPAAGIERRRRSRQDHARGSRGRPMAV
jgi:amino acid transporter